MDTDDINPSELESLYLEEDLTREQLAETLDTEVHRVNYLLRKHGIYKTVFGEVQAIVREREEE
jgi:hypothetical protein